MANLRNEVTRNLSLKHDSLATTFRSNLCLIAVCCVFISFVKKRQLTRFALYEISHACIPRQVRTRRKHAGQSGGLDAVCRHGAAAPVGGQFNQVRANIVGARRRAAAVGARGPGR